MSDAWLDNFAQILRSAKKLDMDVQLAVSSSWDMGGAWVEPNDASKALYYCSTEVRGPTAFDQVLPFPEIARAAPRDEEGDPVFFSEVAVLAIPQTASRLAHEFILKLPASSGSLIDRVVLYNTESDNPQRYGRLHLFSKDFSVAVSNTDAREDSFEEILRDSLEPHAGAQHFTFTATRATYVRLRIYNGHNPRFERVQLGEFEVHSTDGRNVAAGHEVDRTRSSAKLVYFSSEHGNSGRWTADNINDGVRSGAKGSWSSAGSAPLLVSDIDAIADVTDSVDAQGRLKWNVPEGEWTILRFVCANTGEKLKVPSPASNGLATDHFSTGATNRFITYLTDRLTDTFGDLRQTSLRQLYLPSYEVRGAVWTEDFLDQFHKYRGYDATKYLSTLAGYVVDSRDVTDRFIYDFNKTQGDLLVDAYYRTAGECAARVGLGIEAESGGPGPPVHQVPVDALEALGAVDEMRGEFWPWRMDSSSLWVVKETACAAHIYGRQRVHMEAFTGFRHWQDGPFDLKPSADRAFCEGMNHVVWHTSSHQPPEAGKPGWVYGAGTHLTPNLIWWPKAEPFLDYLARCSYMLQEGLFVADVCYYYGDQGYNFVPPKHVHSSLGYGYDYDVVNPEVILTRMSARDGRITLPDGMQYELLVLPERRDIDLAVLRKLEKLVESGATIVGPKPTRSNGLGNYRARTGEIRRIADSMWGPCDGENVLENTYGKGTVIWGRSLRGILSSRAIEPDFQYSADRDGADLDYIHRRNSFADIYFIRNRNQQSESAEATFRIPDKLPELWHPDTGKITEPLRYEFVDGGVRVRLELAPSGSVFVVFRRQHTADTDESSSPTNVVKVLDEIHLEGPWQVRFDPGVGVQESVELAELIPWPEHDHPSVKYFSGIGRYRKRLVIPASWFDDGIRVDLDLGSLWSVGEVYINGRSVGVLWKPPYRLEVSQALKSGINTLEVEVANTWANRLIGEARSATEKKYCRTNITRSGTQWKTWKEIEPRPSGLFGPVRLIAATEQVLPQNSSDSPN